MRDASGQIEACDIAEQKGMRSNTVSQHAFNALTISITIAGNSASRCT